MKLNRKYFILCALALLSGSISAQELPTGLGNISQIHDGLKSRRMSTADLTGNNGDNISGIKPGESKTLTQIKGAGVITHIWITIAPQNIMRNDLILKMYWDGAKYPSVESPIAAFFGNGWDEKYDYSSLPLACGPRDGTGLTSYFHMPFANGARIEIENQSDTNIDHLYFYIDYVEMEKLPKEMGRFHAWYNHEYAGTLPEGESEWGIVAGQKSNHTGVGNYVFADIKGKGHFVGINYYVHCPSPMWYGEGDDMFFIDGAKEPTLIGTGTEDFFNTSWCPKEIFNHTYYGYPRLNWDIGWLGRTHVYRFMITDPVYFQTALKGTIEHGHGNNMTLDLSSVAYWYQSEAKPLPKAPTKADRAPKSFVRDQDMHRWRHEWRKNMGNDSKLWGNEVKPAGK